MKFFFFIILCILMAACTSPISVTVEPTPVYPDLLISMERGACFGTCPIYTLTIHADGTVNYEGKGFVKVEGNRSTKISPDEIQELVDAIEKENFFLLEDRYSVLAKDFPSATLSITLSGRSKSVWHYGSLKCSGEYDKAPKELCKLEKKIDELVNTNQWVQE